MVRVFKVKCFVELSASRGCRSLVGPVAALQASGLLRTLNRTLLEFLS